MTQHTPGPWTFDPDEMSITAETGVMIARVTDLDDFPCVDPDTHDEDAIRRECIANGALLNAAPELLEALINARSILVDVEEWSEDGANIKEIDAAIAKATGK